MSKVFILGSGPAIVRDDGQTARWSLRGAFLAARLALRSGYSTRLLAVLGDGPPAARWSDDNLVPGAAVRLVRYDALHDGVWHQPDGRVRVQDSVSEASTALSRWYSANRLEVEDSDAVLVAAQSVNPTRILLRELLDLERPLVWVGPCVLPNLFHVKPGAAVTTLKQALEATRHSHELDVVASTLRSREGFGEQCLLVAVCTDTYCWFFKDGSAWGLPLPPCLCQRQEDSAVVVGTALAVRGADHHWNGMTFGWLEKPMTAVKHMMAAHESELNEEV